MKKLRIQHYISFLAIILSIHSNAQVTQLSIGSVGVTEIFYDSKYDPNWLMGESINIFITMKKLIV